MADNFKGGGTIGVRTGTTHASDEIDGIHYSVVKITSGESGIATPVLGSSEVLGLILSELRVISFHLSVLTGEQLSETDVSEIS